jgi:two-component system alkaline phosphatase synthesis response regulator PhoP
MAGLKKTEIWAATVWDNAVWGTAVWEVGDMNDRELCILLVEDEEHLAEGIRENLEAEGYRVDLARDGLTALERGSVGQYDLVVLDVMLPELDGFSICQRWRQQGVDTPVLFLTAKGAAEDRIRGLEVGGDDYLAKPFQLRELLLRVAAILKRRARQGPPAIHESVRFGDNEVDFRTYRGRSWDGSDQHLPQKETLILKALAERPGTVVTREELLDKVWGNELFPSTRMLETLVVRLRKRFERDPEAPLFIHTVRGVGYRFTPEGKSE